MHFFLLLLIPFVIGGAAFLISKEVDLKEMAILLGVSIGTLIIGWQVAKWGALQSTEHLNGRITNKVAGTQSCCHCTTVCDSRDSKGNCTASHQDCTHSHDYYWDLESTVGTINIDSCNGWGNPPSVWVNAKVGEPASVEHLYTNYLLADEESLLVHGETAKWVPQVPSYPKHYDFYRVSPVIGSDIPNGWIHELREINADLGAKNQVEVVILTTRVKDPAYAQAVESKWLYGPKNSMTIVMGTDGDIIQWVRVVTFSRIEELKIRLRDQLQGLHLTDPEVLRIVRSEVGQRFHRTAMANMEYLARTAQPTGWILGLLYLVEILVSFGLVYWAVNNRTPTFSKPQWEPNFKSFERDPDFKFLKRRRW